MSHSAEWLRGAIHMALRCGWSSCAYDFQQQLAGAEAAEAREAEAPSAAEVIAAYIEEHGITCDCCQHIMIDVTAVQTDVAQHCVAGDPEGYGSACAWGFHHDEGEKKKLAKEEAVREAADVIEACRVALEGCVALIRTEWFVSDVPANESPAMECDAADEALARIDKWKAAQG